MAKIRAGKTGSKKDIIIKKAAMLFRAKGYNAASMRELADVLNIEAPSLYNHIGSKDELLQAICFKVAEKFMVNMDSMEHLPGNTIGKLEMIIRFHIKMMLENFDEVLVANHEWKYLPAPLLNNFLGQRRNYEKKMITLIEKGIRNKELKKSNAYISMLTILAAIRGIESWHRHKKNISAKILEGTITNQLLKGIVK